MGRLSEYSPEDRAALTGYIEARVEAAREWYERQIGAKAGPTATGRIMEIVLYLEREGLTLPECTLTVSTDANWPERRGVRTPAEAAAHCIGKAPKPGGGSTLFLYIHRKEAP